MTSPEETAYAALSAAFSALTACPTPDAAVLGHLAAAESYVADASLELRRAFPHIDFG